MTEEFFLQIQLLSNQLILNCSTNNEQKKSNRNLATICEIIDYA